MLDTCSNPQKLRQDFNSTMKKIFFVLAFGFFMSDVKRNVCFWLFVPDLGQTARWLQVFCFRFKCKLG